jgi:hypothetical protein
MQIKAYAWNSSKDSILAFGNPDFASDEHRAVQACNRKTGAAMPLIKRADVRNYLATRRQRAHRRLSTSVPVPTGTSENGAVSTRPDFSRSEPAIFAEDFFAEHSPAITAYSLAKHAADPGSSQALATSKSAQA